MSFYSGESWSYLYSVLDTSRAVELLVVLLSLPLFHPLLLFPKTMNPSLQPLNPHPSSPIQHHPIEKHPCHIYHPQFPNNWINPIAINPKTTPDPHTIWCKYCNYNSTCLPLLHTWGWGHEYRFNDEENAGKEMKTHVDEKRRRSRSLGVADKWGIIEDYRPVEYCKNEL